MNSTNSSLKLVDMYRSNTVARQSALAMGHSYELQAIAQNELRERA